MHTLAETALGLIQECDPPLNGGPTLAMLSGEDLLPGWDEDWVLLERERLRQMRLHALDALAESLTRQGKPALALEAAWACVRSEPSVKAPIELPPRRISPREISPKRYVTHAFRRLLHEELGVEPSPAFARMLPPPDGRE
ncbi:bacterial transcriptional activator domain-containing protein [Streptomyces sp. MS1.AVA.1]|uniref:Bacterial transcriptional activator domain-containing protein n=1 Tax=Streptomyces machairae TaxID=3134109 RepID=A0ABU8UVC2_9ACTN